MAYFVVLFLEHDPYLMRASSHTHACTLTRTPTHASPHKFALRDLDKKRPDVTDFSSIDNFISTLPFLFRSVHSVSWVKYKTLRHKFGARAGQRVSGTRVSPVYCQLLTENGKAQIILATIAQSRVPTSGIELGTHRWKASALPTELTRQLCHGQLSSVRILVKVCS